MRTGKKVYIKEMGQYGHVKSVTDDGRVETVTVVTDEGPKIVNVIERGFNVLTLLTSIFQLLLKFVKPSKLMR